MVRALVTREDTVLCFLILDSFLDTAWRTFVTPWPISSRTMYLTIRRLRSMPTPGKTRYNPGREAETASTPCWMAWIVTFSRTAARPQIRPVTTERTSSRVRSGHLCKRARRGPQTYFTPWLSTVLYSSSDPPAYCAMLSSGRVSPEASEASALPPATASFSASSSPSSQRSTSSRSSVFTLIFTR